MAIFKNELNNYLTESFKVLPTTNLTFFPAGILISLPVLGFLPFLAFVFITLKLPKPIKETSSSFFKDSKIVSTNESKNNSVAAFVLPFFVAIELIKSVLNS